MRKEEEKRGESGEKIKVVREKEGEEREVGEWEEERGEDGTE